MTTGGSLRACIRYSLPMTAFLVHPRTFDISLHDFPLALSSLAV